MKNEEHDKYLDLIFGLNEYSNKKIPTIYDAIEYLSGIDLHNRLIFEFSIRNKDNQEYIQKILNFYNNEKINIHSFYDDIHKKEFDWISFKYQLDKNLYKPEKLFYELFEYLNNIEFLPFNYYKRNSCYRHPLIDSRLFIIMNKTFKIKKKITKKTNETQLDKRINENTIEYIGEKGFKQRLEKVKVNEKFLLENHYLNDQNNFFHIRTDIVPISSSPIINEKFIKKNISLNINLGLDESVLKELINNINEEIINIANKHKEALNKYENHFNTEKDDIHDFLRKTKKNIFYSKLLYIYDQNKLYSKEKIRKNIENLDKENKEKFFKEETSENSKDSDKKNEKETIFQKYIFFIRVNKKTSFATNHKILEKELSILHKIINEKLYLQIT